MMKTRDVKRRRSRAARLAFSFVLLAAVATLGTTGCSSKPQARVLTPPPLPTYTGEQYLYSTVGSLANLKSFEPLLVSGYGLVVMPPGTGTGSSDVPTHLRAWLINEMRRKGLGSFSLGTEEMTPRRLLESKDVAVVRVEGLMPAGATQGTKFPVLVTALEQTQTTSLEGGTLWTTDLSIGGADSAMQFRRPLAEAKGAVFLNPFDEKVTAKEKLAFQRQAVVLAGGTVTKDRPIDLTLNQPSWVFSRMIADRVNERFAHEKATEFYNTAVAKSDMVVRINVPARFAGDPQKLLRLISRMFLRKSTDFEGDKAQQLGKVLVARKDQAAAICEAWQALGKTALPVIREYYQHEKDYVRLTALEAGAWLEDDLAAGELATLAVDADAATRRKACQLLGRLPRSTRATMALRSLLDDVDRSVRIAAYEALADFGDTAVHRVPMGDRTQFKFFLDVVQSKDPLVYISQRDVPRLVVFSPNAGFKEYIAVELWEGRFRLQGGDANEQISVFYQSTTDPKGKVQKIAPTVANLAVVMGHRASAERPFEGFDLSYSSIVNAMFNLQKKGDLLAQIEIAKNPLAVEVDRFRNQDNTGTRPEEEEGDEQPTVAAPPTGTTPTGTVPDPDLTPVTAGPAREPRPE